MDRTTRRKHLDPVQRIERIEEDLDEHDATLSGVNARLNTLIAMVFTFGVAIVSVLVR